MKTNILRDPKNLLLTDLENTLNFDTRDVAQDCFALRNEKCASYITLLQNITSVSNEVMSRVSGLHCKDNDWFCYRCPVQNRVRQKT